MQIRLNSFQIKFVSQMFSQPSHVPNKLPAKLSCCCCTCCFVLFLCLCVCPSACLFVFQLRLASSCLRHLQPDCFTQIFVATVFQQQRKTEKEKGKIESEFVFFLLEVSFNLIFVCEKSCRDIVSICVVNFGRRRCLMTKSTQIRTYVPTF